jgi:hypothetical protein
MSAPRLSSTVGKPFHLPTSYLHLKTRWDTCTSSGYRGGGFPELMSGKCLKQNKHYCCCVKNSQWLFGIDIEKMSFHSLGST